MRIANINRANNINFQAGKFSLYSDFDGTYMPFSHKDMCTYDRFECSSAVREKFNRNFQPFQKFFEQYKDNAEFTITTGRTRPEFLYFMDKLESQGAKLYKPDMLITSDGKEIFYKKDDTYPIETKDKNKVAQMVEMSGWNPDVILPEIEDIVVNTPTKNGEKLKIVKPLISRNKSDYGASSLQYMLDKDEDLERSFASFAQGFDFKPCIFLSDNAYGEKIAENIDTMLKEKNIKADVEYYKEDWNMSNEKPYQSIIIRPLFKNGILEGKKADKLIDTHKKVKEIYDNKTDDLVIVAGDAINDKDMLNIFNYTDILGLGVPKEEEYENFVDNSSNRELLAKLPAMFIVAGNNADLWRIKENDMLLKKYGINKTVFVDQQLNQTLLDGVKQSVLLYSDVNEEFKKGLGSKLLEELNKGCNLFENKTCDLMETAESLSEKLGIEDVNVPDAT